MKSATRPVNLSPADLVDSQGVGRAHPLRRLAGWLLPATCILCRLPARANDLCKGCAADLPWLRLACARCALPLQATHAGQHCAACQARPPPWRQAIAALNYHWPADQLVQAFKYRDQQLAGRLLAHCLAQVVAERMAAGTALKPDVLVPVPVSRWRLAWRGFNQAGVLAADVGRALGLPLIEGWLCRRPGGPPQATLSGAQRRRNLRHAFVLERRRQPAEVPQTVALVDDVMTTGSTLDACTRVLQADGVREVVLWVVARTP